MATEQRRLRKIKMGYYFSEQSNNILTHCDERLKEILREAIKYVDFSILCSFRNQAAQTEAFEANKSYLEWPNSNHNAYPSLAVDVAPYPIDWNDTRRFHYLAGVIMTIAQQKEIPIVWGGTFKFFDGPHFEIGV